MTTIDEYQDVMDIRDIIDLIEEIEADPESDEKEEAAAMRAPTKTFAIGSLATSRRAA